MSEDKPEHDVSQDEDNGRTSWLGLSHEHLELIDAVAAGSAMVEMILQPTLIGQLEARRSQQSAMSSSLGCSC